MCKFLQEQLAKLWEFLPRASLKLRHLIIVLRQLRKITVIGLSIMFILWHGWQYLRADQVIIPEKGEIELSH